MSAPIAGSRVLLTGASSGIGAALAPMLAARGAVVAITGRRADRLGQVLEECRAHQSACRSYEVDLAGTAAADELAARVVADLGPVDILVNNAGAPMRRRAPELSLAEIDTTMTVNFT